MFRKCHNRLICTATTLVTCLILSGCSKNTSAIHIERVLKVDQTTITGAKSVTEVVARMRAINLAGCPHDFTAAYITHIHAWERLEDVEQDAIAFDRDFNSAGAFLEAFVRGLMLDPFGKARECNAEQNRLRTNHKKAMTQIRDSFHHVEGIAVVHKAVLPKREAQR